jgi:hypothetical protein
MRDAVTVMCSVEWHEGTRTNYPIVTAHRHSWNPTSFPTMGYIHAIPSAIAGEATRRPLPLDCRNRNRNASTIFAQVRCERIHRMPQRAIDRGDRPRNENPARCGGGGMARTFVSVRNVEYGGRVGIFDRPLLLPSVSTKSTPRLHSSCPGLLLVMPSSHRRAKKLWRKGRKGIFTIFAR